MHGLVRVKRDEAPSLLTVTGAIRMCSLGMPLWR